MEQKIIHLSGNRRKIVIARAAKIIRRGGLVAFPTETVYGLGASALNRKAVKKIFTAKGRPLDNPLIVHVGSFGDIKILAKDIPPETLGLIKKFWPGPLTIVLRKKRIVPREVTAGGDTVAIRMPDNKIALELIKRAGVPIAAPSANLAGRPSPTIAKHVFDDLGESVDLILDGGKTAIGLESTVVDLTTKPFLVLRPGGVSFRELKKVLKNIRLHSNLSGGELKDKAKSPGMKYRHYAPQAPMVLIGGKESSKKIQNLIKKHREKNKKVGVMCSKETKRFYKEADLVLGLGSRKKPEEIAKNLFSALRAFDKTKIDIIFSETFPGKGIEPAIMDRLKRASKKQWMF